MVVQCADLTLNPLFNLSIQKTYISSAFWLVRWATHLHLLLHSLYHSSRQSSTWETGLVECIKPIGRIQFHDLTVIHHVGSKKEGIREMILFSSSINLLEHFHCCGKENSWTHSLIEHSMQSDGSFLGNLHRYRYCKTEFRFYNFFSIVFLLAASMHKTFSLQIMVL